MESFVLAGLRKLPAELAHALTLRLLTQRAKILPAHKKNGAAKQFMGLNFTNLCGIAAGLDKNGDCIEGLQALGVGFIELGTVTPQAQRGNPPPRLWRLPPQQAIINHLGFNNKGVDYLARRLSQAMHTCILGVNIGKGVYTPIEKAAKDYLLCFEKLHPYADYLCINISSPNTTGLRRLQEKNRLAPLLTQLKEKQADLKQRTQKYTPLVVKIAPDLTEQNIRNIASLINDLEIDGVAATNTTTQHSYYYHGGLSGKPLCAIALRILELLRNELTRKICLIGVGGISSKEDMRKRITAGADLIQIYTGLVYQGTSLLNQLIQYETTRD